MANAVGKLVGKAALILAIFIFIVISYCALIGTIDFRLHLPLLLQAQPPVRSSCRPLRIYMYEIPRRFHVAMLDHRDADEEPVTAVNFPGWPVHSGLNKQHSVEYWMMASLLHRPGGTAGGGTGEAIRVLNPETADVFFVPFFSSLSFNTHGHHMTDPDTEIDRKLQADLLNILWGSKYWQKSLGRDHVIPVHHPNAFRFMKESVNASILVVSDFARSSMAMSNLAKDVVAPYVHVVESFNGDDSPDPFESRAVLLFFKGTTVRKDEGIVRARLEKVLNGYPDVRYEQSFASRENIRLSTEGMRSSKFCLHPAGDTPSSCRLFDAIVSHCVPVIVSDRIELPFEDEMDYTEFSIFFSVKKALRPGYMVNRLRHVSKERWLGMWLRLKNVSKHFEFHNPPREEDAVNMIWRQVRHKLPSTHLSLHRNKRLKIPDWWMPKTG